MKIVKLLPLLLLISGASISNANASLLGCFDCSSNQSKIEAISEYNSSNMNEGFIEVIDFKNNVVRSYTMEYDPESGQTFVMSSASTSDAKTKAATLTAQYNELQTAEKAVNHTNTEFSSAYDVVQSKNYLSVTNDYMNQTNTIDKLGVYSGVVFSSLGKVVENVNIVIDVAFPDGSLITFKISGIDSGHNIEFEVLEATDSENNDIPLNIDQIQGHYQFSSEKLNWINYGNLIESYGISISDWASLFEQRTGSVVIRDIVCTSAEECKVVN